MSAATVRPPLSVIIVTWNGLRYLPECFAALMPQLPPNAEVVLVDNASTDGTLEWISATYPETHLVQLAQNTGFAGGCAAGLRVASGELLLLLNNDAFVEPGCIAALLTVMQERPEIGAAGGVLTFAHRPELVASAGIRARRDGVALDLWAGRAVTNLPGAPVDVMGPTGALALYRRALIDDVGPTEPTFFNYLEDVDLAWRALLRGWRSVVVPAARARHVYSATGGQGSPFKQLLLGRNRIRAIMRCFPASLLLRCLPQIILYDLMATGYGLATGQRAIITGRLAALRDLPTLLRQRRAIQRARSAPTRALADWLTAPPAPWNSLREQQALDRILAQR